MRNGCLNSNESSLHNQYLLRDLINTCTKKFLDFKGKNTFTKHNLRLRVIQLFSILSLNNMDSFLLIFVMFTLTLTTGTAYGSIQWTIIRYPGLADNYVKQLKDFKS